MPSIMRYAIDVPPNTAGIKPPHATRLDPPELPDAPHGIAVYDFALAPAQLQAYGLRPIVEGALIEPCAKAFVNRLMQVDPSGIECAALEFMVNENFEKAKALISKSDVLQEAFRVPVVIRDAEGLVRRIIELARLQKMGSERFVA